MNDYRRFKENRHIRLTEDIEKEDVNVRSSQTSKGKILKGHSMF